MIRFTVFSIYITLLIFFSGCSFGNDTVSYHICEEEPTILNWTSKNSSPSSYPNVIFILVDDMGYGDLGHRSDVNCTPWIDSMAKNGLSFLTCYSGGSICSPSRASIMTGKYPFRMGLANNVYPWNKTRGLPKDEITIADLFVQNGYETYYVGKWHLGLSKEFWPTENGFKHFYGSLLSNNQFPYELMDGDSLIEVSPDNNLITSVLTSKAKQYILDTYKDPFFLFISHVMPHIPVGASDKFLGTSNNGLYGDAISELDWSVGRIVELVDSLDIMDNTLFIFTSDNGAGNYIGEIVGSNTPFRGAKDSPFEGGHRVPLIMYWNGVLPKLEINTIVTHMDILPTISSLIDSKIDLPSIDGMDLSQLFIEMDSSLQFDERPFYYMDRIPQIAAIRKGDFKLITPINYNKSEPKVDTYELFNLKIDPKESVNIFDDNKDLADSLLAQIAQFEAENFN